jgi:hypothetical protein
MSVPSALLVAASLIVLSGCQLIGPSSIDTGRGRYNDVIQTTSMVQTMANIVRVSRHEPPLFMDVTEVDATVSAGGSLTAGGANIGVKKAAATGQIGSVGGTTQFSETPTVRYQPLLGQALVAQLVTPVSADALGLLYDSSWDVAPLLDFSAAYLTLDPREFYPALNTIMELHDKEAVELVASQSSLTKSDDKTADKAPTQTQVTKNL